MYISEWHTNPYFGWLLITIRVGKPVVTLDTCTYIFYVCVLAGTRAAKWLPGTHQVSLTATCQSDFQTKRSLFRSQNWTCVVSQIKKYKIIIVYEQYKHIFYGDIDKYIIYMHYTAIRSLLLILSRFIGLPPFSYLPLYKNKISLIYIWHVVSIDLHFFTWSSQ